MDDLSGKIALVTGGSRGIGRAIAVSLAKSGALVVINFASNQEQAEKTAQTIRDNQSLAPLLSQFDVADSKAVQAALAKIESDVGGIDILVNCAGIVKDGLLVRYKDEDWHKVIDVNLASAFYCARACSRHMMKKRWGRIINISSIVGESGNAGQVAYASAKSGMIGMTKSLALELASRSVTVNAVTPGYIDTDMTASLSEAARSMLLERIPLGFVGSPEDIANAVAFLASDNARYITGHVLSVNGGLYI